MGRGCCFRLTWVLSVLLAVAGSARARTLLVGANAAYAVPSAAAARAHDGDRVVIAAGRYVDCAVWRADRLEIVGAGIDRTIITGPVCGAKGLFVVSGRNITIRDLSLQGAHLPWHNAAGIRAEGANLTVIGVRFADDENGILTAPDPHSTLLVRNSEFLGDGSCLGPCAHGIYASRIGRLLVEHSRFRDTRQGHHIKSRALSTVISDCDIADGPDGTASYLIDIPDGGAVSITGNRLEKGPRSDNPSTAIMLGEESRGNPTPYIRIERNLFRNGGVPTVFVRNDTPTPAILSGNRLLGPVPFALIGRGRS